MLIEPSSLQVNENEHVDISAYLRRNTGSVSLNTQVSFFAYQLDGATELPVGRFTGTSKGTDGEGKVTVQFFADSANIDPAKPIKVRITTTKDDSEALAKTIDLTFNPAEEG